MVWQFNVLLLLACCFSVVYTETSILETLELGTPISVSDTSLSTLPSLPPGFRPFSALQSKIMAKGKKTISTSTTTTTANTNSLTNIRGKNGKKANGYSGSDSNEENANSSDNHNNSSSSSSWSARTVFLPPISLPSAPFQSQQIRPEDKSSLSDEEILYLLTNHEGNSSDIINSNSSSDGSSNISSSSNEEKNLAFLYDQLAFHNWNIEMKESDIDKLNADPTKEESYPCSITSMYGSGNMYEQKHSFPSMGCRYKGSVGSLRLCVDEYHHLNHNCRKLTWAVSTNALKTMLNHTQPPPLIHGAESLFFGGCPVDWSMMSERMAFFLLNKLNITASNAVHAKLFLNGKFLGVYSFVQPIDRIFTHQHFSSDNNKGNGGLYKEVWFNNQSNVMSKNLSVHEGKNENNFMYTVMGKIITTPLKKVNALRMLEQYFDVSSLVDVTAFNSAIGDTDDWRQRHNFYWYVRDDKKGKKLVLLPWDYDRLYDSQALTRGALAGKPWWDIKHTASPSICNAPIQTPEELANQTATNPGELELWTSIYESLPSDLEIPVSCDKITQLMALALGSRIRARTREFLNIISLEQIQILFNTWNQQLELALSYDPDGPSGNFMRSEQAALLTHLANASELALRQADEGDRMYNHSLR